MRQTIPVATDGRSQTVQLLAPDTDVVGVCEFDGQLRLAPDYIWRNVRCRGARGLGVKSPKPHLTRIAFLLENAEARAEFCKQPHLSARTGQRAHGMSVVPAGETVWVCSEQGGPLELASLAFDADRMAERWGEDLSSERLSEPRLNFFDERLWSLGRRLAEECRVPGAVSELYFDSCVAMLIIELLRLGKEQREPVKRRGLSRQQLARVTEFIEQNLSKRILLCELAELAGVSVSHFCHAFKQSTGSPPHRWQLEARIRRAQRLLIGKPRPLSRVAMDVGFADQAHFTRVFRQLVGVTPRAWQRDREG